MASVSLALLAAVSLGGCKTTALNEATGSIKSLASGSSNDLAREGIDGLGERYRKNPRDPETAVRYAHALRQNGQRQQAAAVLEQLSLHNPRNRYVLGAYGRALADLGNYKQALDVLDRAHTPDQPDWRILSVKGAVLDQIGQHEEARRQYTAALRIKPNDSSVLSNLGLSYALSKDLQKAEETLKQAVAQPGSHPRARQNLALVVGLQGRFADAEQMARADLPPDEAAENVAYLKQMLAQPNAIKRLRSSSG